ncbi:MULTISPECIES: hypothetical protein [Alphaproteobacteria]|uniref:Uncharacterized protein n=2 Tax=Alphaproteobacteria TaxID=28211 RepID=A0A9W7NIK8_9PROT|nr:MULTISPECIES: hypothetical protein [Rhodospirillales]KAA0679545.1 hypothetical protein DS843_16555 [Roseomonas genomospecies 6]KAA0686232.1 hypothetical protein DS837_11080 [Azospirillum brasilense]
MMKDREEVGHLRCDCPMYLYEQIREFTHKNRMTIMAMIANALMRAYPDDFDIAPEDLVADKRRLPKPAAPETRGASPGAMLFPMAPSSIQLSRRSRRGRR